MRTTVNIDDVLMTRLKTKAHAENKTFTAVVNEILWSSLREKQNEEPFRQVTASLGTHPGIDLTKALDFAAELETSYSVGKMEIGK